MKLTDMFVKHRLQIQLLWGEQKIEFPSEIMDNDGSAIYVRPYYHHGSVLELNVVPDGGVICNLFTDDPATRQRVSWKNVELTTLSRNEETMYRISTKDFNNAARQDDRRQHERMVVQVKGMVTDEESEERVNIIVHDISDIGVSFYAPLSYTPKTAQVIVEFSDYIDDKDFEMKLECAIARIDAKAGNAFVGCKIVKENKDFKLYGFMKRLREKNKNKLKEVESAREDNN